MLACIARHSHQEAKAAYGVLVMAVYWMTESIPLPATALMPMFIFPMLGVMGAKDIAKNYLKVGLKRSVLSKSTLYRSMPLRRSNDCLFTCFVCLSVCLFVCLSVCLFVYPLVCHSVSFISSFWLAITLCRYTHCQYNEM